MAQKKRKTKGRAAVYQNHNLTQNGSHKPDHPCKTKNLENTRHRFSGLRNGFCKTQEAGFLLVNKTDQARVQFTSTPSVAQVVGDAKRKNLDTQNKEKK